MDVPIGNEGNLNGATAVTALAAPGTANVQRTVPANGAGAYNADTVAHDFIWQKNKNSTITVLFKAATVAAGAHTLLGKKVVLDATDESLEVKLEGAHTTTAPTFDVAALECS
jgi:hypothetical protein